MMEWGDKLLPKGPWEGPPDDKRMPVVPPRPGRGEALRELFQPGAFYKDLADQILAWSGPLRPQRICDVGGSTGRLMAELSAGMQKSWASQPGELLLVEQSEVFCAWARKLLQGEQDEHTCWVPLPRYPDEAHFERVDLSSLRATTLPVIKGLEICCASGEEVPRPDGYFPLVICSNVIDRHPEPKSFVERLTRLVAPDGHLVLASPFDFELQFTPQQSRWVHDLEDVLPVGWGALEKTEIAYVHRKSRWDYPCFISQVICAGRSA
jgi:SAM-dependent methyltransferase